MPKVKGLTAKQKRFVNEYIIDLNASQAAVRAGYAPKRVGAQAYKLMNNPLVKEEIEKRLKKLEERVQMHQEDVFKELVKIARADMADFAAWGPGGVQFTNSANLRREDTAAVAEISETVTEAGGTKRIKLHDKLKSLELLGKYYSMYTDNVNLKGDAEIEVQIKKKQEDQEPGGD